MATTSKASATRTALAKAAPATPQPTDTPDEVLAAFVRVLSAFDDFHARISDAGQKHGRHVLSEDHFNAMSDIENEVVDVMRQAAREPVTHTKRFIPRAG